MGKLLYTDGANYKFEFDAKLPPDTNVGDELTLEDVGYTKKTFFGKNNVRGYKYDREIDHNIIEVLEVEYSDLPNNWWEIVENFYPNYYSCDEILRNDRLSTYIDFNEGREEMDEDEVIEFEEEFPSVQNAVLEYEKHSVGLYLEALTEKMAGREHGMPNFAKQIEEDKLIKRMHKASEPIVEIFDKPKQETVYYIFGDTACEMVRSHKTTLNDILEWCKSDEADYSLFEFIVGETHPSTLLNCYCGWGDSEEIIEEIYKAIKNITV